MLAYDEDLPETPTEAEARFAAEIGEEGIAKIDAALIQATRPRRLKAARIVWDAMEIQGFPYEEGCIHLHVRRLEHLVEEGRLKGVGVLWRPRYSEVWKPEGNDSKDG